MGGASHARSFRALNLTQFLTVLNDSAFKQVILLLALDVEGFGPNAQSVGQFLFALPFLLFAMYSGDLSDRYSKRRMVVGSKYAEVTIMALGIGGFLLGDFLGLLVLLFLMGTQSVFLGPAKYGLLPELVAPGRLPHANAVFQLTVIGGILLGIPLAGVLVEHLREQLWIAGALFTVVAIVGSRVAARIAPIPAADPGRKPSLWPGPALKAAWKQEYLPGVMLGHAVFWLVGSLVLLSWNELGIKHLGMKEGIWSAGLGSLSIATGIGCFVAGRLSARRLRLEWAAPAAWVMAACFLGVAVGPQQPWWIWALMLVGNFALGFYLIPLRTLIQTLPADEDKGRTLGASQMLDWSGILLASGIAFASRAMGLDARQDFYLLTGIFGVTGLLLVRVARNPGLRSRLQLGSTQPNPTGADAPSPDQSALR